MSITFTGPSRAARAMIISGPFFVGARQGNLHGQGDASARGEPELQFLPLVVLPLLHNGYRYVSRSWVGTSLYSTILSDLIGFVTGGVRGAASKITLVV